MWDEDEEFDDKMKVIFVGEPDVGKISIISTFREQRNYLTEEEEEKEKNEDKKNDDKNNSENEEENNEKKNNEVYIPYTIGRTFQVKSLLFEDKILRFDIWDSTGQKIL